MGAARVCQKRLGYRTAAIGCERMSIYKEGVRTTMGFPRESLGSLGVVVLACRIFMSACDCDLFV